MREYTAEKRRVHWVFWPLVALWRIVTWFGEAIGIIASICLGLLFMMMGYFLMQTILLAFIGLPLFLLGFLLLLRGLW